MSASSFHVYYGLRWELTDSDLTMYERRESPQHIAAREFNLDCWWGVTNEESHYLLLGACIGHFGWEDLGHKSTNDREFENLVAETKSKLIAAKFADTPELHCQFEPDF